MLARFGTRGVRRTGWPAGIDEHPTPPAPPPPDLVETAELDPPATRVDEAAFAAKMLADRLLGRLAGLGLSCSQVRGGGRDRARGAARAVLASRGRAHARRARRPRALAARRVARAAPQGASVSERPWTDEFTTGGLTLVRLVPERGRCRPTGASSASGAAMPRRATVPIACLARVQGMLGHDAVVTAVPWAVGRPRSACAGCRGATHATTPIRVRRAPWPGAVPGPSPARVYAPPLARRAARRRRRGGRGVGPRRGHGGTGPAVVRRAPGRRGPGHGLGGSVAPRRALVGPRHPPPARAVARGGG